jgi:hypothetical protein
LWVFWDARWLGGLQISVGLREAHNASLPWTYSSILSLSYCGYTCRYTWYYNYNNSLVGSYTFAELTPNTLYTVALLTCYPLCFVGGTGYSQYSNITTRPEDPQFHINSSTSTSITVQFQYNYYTGPPPHGHEVVVQNKDLNSVLSYSSYFQISILHAVISGLSPNTEYVLHIRANGSHHAGNYGRWKSVEVKTQPADLHAAVELTTTGESVHLTWSPPSVTEGASITGYEATIATTETRVIKYSSSTREITFEGLQPLTVYEVKLRVRVSSGSTRLLQLFYSANVTTVEKSNTEAVVNGVGGAAVMLAIVGVIIAIVVGGVIVGCFVRKKRRIQSPKQSEEGADDINMEKNPAYGDLNVKDQSPSREVDARYTTSGNPTGQQPYEEIAFHY